MAAAADVEAPATPPSKPGGKAPVDVKARLGDLPVFSATSGSRLDAANLIPSGRAVLFLMTDYADFDSWEQAQRLVDELPKLQAASVPVICIGIGTVEAAREFCTRTCLPPDVMFADPEGACHKALGLEPGFGREGGLLGELPISGYLKVLAMCAGIGSEGTLREVFRGYLGDAASGPVFRDGSNVDLGWKKLFDLVGKDYQRPFELATWRLANMVEIISNWEALAPADDQLLGQRGGAFVVEGGKALLIHRDTGILGYAEPDRFVKAALSPVPAAPPTIEESLAVVRRAAQRQPVMARDVYRAIRRLEKRPKEAYPPELFRGQWKLAYNSGLVKVVDGDNFARAGAGGFFPLTASISFDPATEPGADGRIRNGIYAGPLAFFFDGPMFWRPGKNVLEFQFDRMSLGVGADLCASTEIPSGEWKAEGDLAGDKRGNKTPFFKIIHADAECLVARGRSGGLAVWGRIAKDPITAAPGVYSKIGE